MGHFVGNFDYAESSTSNESHCTSTINEDEFEPVIAGYNKENGASSMDSIPVRDIDSDSPLLWVDYFLYEI